MNRIPVVFAALAASLMLSGCKSAPQPVSPTSPPFSAAPTPAATRTDEQVAADKKFLEDVEKKKRKSHSAYINKTKAYQNYIP